MDADDYDDGQTLLPGWRRWAGWAALLVAVAVVAVVAAGSEGWQTLRGGRQ